MSNLVEQRICLKFWVLSKNHVIGSIQNVDGNPEGFDTDKNKK